MGILPTSPKLKEKSLPSNSKRRSMQADFANLKPLNPNGMRGFSNFRDPTERSHINGNGKGKMGKKRQDHADSDDDLDIKTEDLTNNEDFESKDANSLLSPEDAKRQKELAEGVQKIKVMELLKQ